MRFYSRLVSISAIDPALPDQLGQKLSELKLAVWLSLYVKNKFHRIMGNQKKAQVKAHFMYAWYSGYVAGGS